VSVQPEELVRVPIAQSDYSRGERVVRSNLKALGLPIEEMCPENRNLASYGRCGAFANGSFFFFHFC